MTYVEELPRLLSLIKNPKGVLTNEVIGEGYVVIVKLKANQPSYA